MNDRELLEMAAKAADIALVWNDKESPGYYSEWRGLPQWEDWNPLTDDGDALRLAVKLHLKLECMLGQTAARTFDNLHAGCVDHADASQYQGRDFDPDPNAATRRAIVRAAAEIGRAMR